MVSALLNYSCPKEALTSKSTGLINSINLILLHLELETALSLACFFIYLVKKAMRPHWKIAKNIAYRIKASLKIKDLVVFMYDDRYLILMFAHV